MTDVLDTLAPGGGDAWLATSTDGAELLVATERLDTTCLGGACLAVVSGDLSTANLVLTAGEVIRPEGFSALSSSGRIVYPLGGGPSHVLDLWRLDAVVRSGRRPCC